MNRNLYIIMIKVFIVIANSYSINNEMIYNIPICVYKPDRSIFKLIYSTYIIHDILSTLYWDFFYIGANSNSNHPRYLEKLDGFEYCMYVCTYDKVNQRGGKI